ncbi:MAG: hypothetical protein B7Z52_06005 [Burkholderiales bacterium 12-64-5]|nr:MAG: hypothetical protein B7Z52_06005 [Burkholderiales bacterium 12-64-5]
MRALWLLALPLAFVASAAAAPQVDTYLGLCDASAAIALDATHFVVGEDEHDVLVTYRFGRPEPIARLDLVDVLGNRRKNGKPREADIEGAARIGSRIYWIASHSRDGGGDAEPTRQRLFATEIAPGAGVPALAPAGRPYTGLLRDLLAAALQPGALAALDLAQAARQPPESPGGLNIEGLAAAPDGSLLIAFRNPRPAGRALLLPLTNAAALVRGDGPARFGAPIQLDLGQRGIRSIERVGEGYVLVAGPHDDGGHGPGGDFALYRWGGPGTQPEQMAVDLGSLNPEAVFQTLDAARLYLLSDDGGKKVDGHACKDKKVPAARKSFRGMALPPP